MLEAVHLTKIYKTRGGKDVRALDDVSVRFPEKGMVFLLGKSGSGKSTLLNVCGGLDSPTSGEVVVKGRSSKKFSQSDFDSYRNTFVGFVFQEYNILNEFSVEENIAIALKLQGKRKNKKVIADLLAQVELTGYGKRKPNTLSGGQKQRIAIARALVKNPEIIMADEPTGALDSATGKQVFDTLKKLSKDKLVIVVSHDREFAEQYADRIIELKDGKIISDVSKTYEEQKSASAQIVAIGDTLSVKNGAALTDSDFEYIKKFLLSAEGGAIITSGDKEMQAFRKVNRITEEGQREVFKDTRGEDIPAKTYTPKESKFIRSHLPVGYAFKMGASGLRLKPVRLFFTIFLATIAFIMFGLTSTMMFFNSTEVLRSSIISGGYTSVNIYKEQYTTAEGFLGAYSVSLTISRSEVEGYRKKFGSDAIGLKSDGVEQIENVNIDSKYYSAQILYKIYAEDAEQYLSDRLLVGAYPSEDITSDDDGRAIYEIAISDYTADSLLSGSLFNRISGGEYSSLNERSDLLEKQIMFEGDDAVCFKIVGVFSGGDIPVKYDSLKNKDDSTLSSVLREFLSDGLQKSAVFPSSYLKDSAWIRGYDYVNIPLNSSNAALLGSIVSFSVSSPTSTEVRIYTNLSISVAYVTSVVKIFSMVFLSIGLTLAFFSSLLLGNFISVSISNKKKEIGILRAVGARGADVFKIFYSESFIITFICVALAELATFALCGVLNSILCEMNYMFYIINMFVFGPFPVVILAGIAALTSIIATFLPVSRAARKKPVESIRAL